MAGPWEKYQQAPAASAPQGDGPWAKYASPTATTSDGSTIPVDVVTPGQDIDSQASAFYAAKAKGDENGATQAFRSIRSQGGTLRGPSPDEVSALQANKSADSGSAADFGGALAHHAMNGVVGAGQLVAHVGNYVAGGGLQGELNRKYQEDELNHSVGGLVAGGNIKLPTSPADGAVSAMDQAIKDREDSYQKNVPNTPMAYLGAGIGEVVPAALGLTGLRAAGFLPAAASKIGKVGSLAYEGGLLGGIQPVTGGDFSNTKAAQVAAGAATSAGIGSTGMGLAGVYRGTKGVLNQALNPDAAVGSNLAKLYGSDPSVIAALRNAPELVPGEVPTAAQALKTPQAVQAERMLRNNPEAGKAFLDRDNSNNAARLNVVQGLAGSDDALNSAVQARRDATAPFFKDYLAPSTPQQRYSNAQAALALVKGRMSGADFNALREARLITGRVLRGSIDEGEAADQLNAISVKSKNAQKALDQAVASINQNMIDPTRIAKQLQQLTLSGNPTVANAAKSHLDLISRNADAAGMVPARALDDMRQNIGSMLSAHATNGVVGSQESALYAPVTAKINSTLERAIPGYRNNLATYAKLSQPITDMESAQGLLDPNVSGSLNTAGDPQLAISRLRTALRSDDRSKYGISDDARKQLENVRDSLLRRSISDNKTGASGSNTAADMQLMPQGGLLGRAVFGSGLNNKGGWVGRSIGGGIGGLLGSSLGPAGASGGAALGLGITDAIGASNARALGRIGETAADSKATAAAIEAWIAKQPKGQQGILNSYLLGLPAAPAASTRK